MTAHEVFNSLFWLVAIGYALYLGWFAQRWISKRRGTGKVAEPSTNSRR